MCPVQRDYFLRIKHGPSRCPQCVRQLTINQYRLLVMPPLNHCLSDSKHFNLFFSAFCSTRLITITSHQVSENGFNCQQKAPRSQLLHTVKK
ncbi:hypothetical protein XELAEV_18025984mg [Xenopus laevis]|uniref:Uncharacterized protein n=1 Tax=Xenopus laevis TaxID=8355 RepID=A0A974D310_XENLA|nr:hypothetical protein XELAEV_18025984mg [Xenopus laevis]